MTWADPSAPIFLIVGLVIIWLLLPCALCRMGKHRWNYRDYRTSAGDARYRFCSACGRYERL